MAKKSPHQVSVVGSAARAVRELNEPTVVAVAGPELSTWCTTRTAHSWLPPFPNKPIAVRTTQDRDLFDRFHGVAITSAGPGLSGANNRRSLDIVQ